MTATAAWGPPVGSLRNNVILMRGHAASLRRRTRRHAG
jgi:hypothetical protein